MFSTILSSLANWLLRIAALFVSFVVVQFLVNYYRGSSIVFGSVNGIDPFPFLWLTLILSLFVLAPISVVFGLLDASGETTSGPAWQDHSRCESERRRRIGLDKHRRQSQPVST